jgi:hypothetical protein
MLCDMLYGRISSGPKYDAKSLWAWRRELPEREGMGISFSEPAFDSLHNANNATIERRLDKALAILPDILAVVRLHAL